MPTQVCRGYDSQWSSAICSSHVKASASGSCSITLKKTWTHGHSVCFQVLHTQEDKQNNKSRRGPSSTSCYRALYRSVVYV